MKTLITGANGQLGLAVARDIEKLFPDWEIIKRDIDTLDITDEESVLKEAKGVSFIINCAAFTNVDLCEDEKDIAYKVNCVGVKNLAKACNENGATLVHISTDYVFSGDKNSPFVETDEINPQSEYGRGKADGEKEARKCKKHFILRTSWLYSPDGKNFVKTMLSLGRQGKSLKVVNDQVGTPTLCKDLSNVIVNLIKTENYGTYHCTGNGEPCSWYEFACKIFEIANIDADISPCTSQQFPQKAKRPTYSVLENKNLKDIGLDLMRDWKIALEECLTTERI